MQRRRFMQTVTTAGAAAGALPAQQTARPPVAEPVKITTVPADAVAEPAQRFFSPRQFATLTRLAALLQPASNGRPGAIEAGAPQFLDFLIGVSPQPRQDRYRDGLNFMDAEAVRLFRKPFEQIDDAQADKIIRPLLAPWTFDVPADPQKHFLTELRADVRTATQNSKEMSQVPSTGRRRGVGGAAPYWLPIDPTRS